MLATDVISAARTWRPAEYGDKRAADIDDALVEPLWTGPRVLALIANGEASMTAAEGDSIDGREDVLADLVDAAGGGTLLLEGVLTAEPLQGVEELVGRDTITTPDAARMASQMILGDRLER